MMTDQVFARAVQLAGELDARQTDLLRVLCGISVSALASRLKEGLVPENCEEVFLTAASLYALADLGAVAETEQVAEFKAGDLTVKQGGSRNPDAVYRHLQRQAEGLMAPYLKDRFSFAGV